MTENQKVKENEEDIEEEDRSNRIMFQKNYKN